MPSHQPSKAPRKAVPADLPVEVRGPILLPATRLLRKGDRPQVEGAATPAEQGRRLRQARINAGFRTASDAARQLGIAGPTYLAHENGTRTIRHDMAIFYAQQYGVSTDWLMNNPAVNNSEPQPVRPAPNRGVMPLHRPSLGPPDAQDPEFGARKRLMESLRVSRKPDGSIIMVGESEPAGLPVVLRRPYYLPELALPRGDAQERLVQLDADRPEGLMLAVRDIVAVPGEMPDDGRYFVFVPDRRDPILAGLPRVHAMVFDVGGLEYLNERPTLAIAASGNRLALVLATRDNSGVTRPEATTLLGTAVLSIQDCSEAFLRSQARQIA